jgi:sugar porter (SP) family MFS transporter
MTSQKNRTPDGRRDAATSRVTPLLVLTAGVAAVGGLLYGYDTGIISGALLQISKEFKIGSAMKQVVTASILLGAVVGALACSWLSARRGRRGTILIVAATFAVGALASALSPSPLALSASRVLLGFAVGGGTQTIPMYVAELAPPARRGRLVLMFQTAIGVGIVIATIVGATKSLSWRTAIGAAAVPAVAMLLAMIRLPESPRWLFKRDRRDDAQAVLERIRPRGSDVEPELKEICEIERQERTAATRGWAGLRADWVRPALIVGCGIAAFTQLSGIEMIIYYSPTILTNNGFSDSEALLVSVGLGVTYLVMMLVGLSIIDRVGRRRLTLRMVPGAAAALFALGAIFVFGIASRSTTGWIIACLIIFMVFNAGGLQLMGWLTGSEIYPLPVRANGTAVQAAVLWGTNLLITLTLLTIINAIGVGPTMWMYGLFNVAAFLFVLRLMPELTGRSLEQIEAALEQGNFGPESFAEPQRTAPTRPQKRTLPAGAAFGRSPSSQS